MGEFGLVEAGGILVSLECGNRLKDRVSTTIRVEG